MNSTGFLRKTFTSGIFFLIIFLLFVYIPDPKSDSKDSPLSFPSPNIFIGEPEKINFEEESSVSIQLNRKIIQANSLEEQIFPLLVSRRIPEIKSPYRKPVDLACVISLKESGYYPPQNQIEDIKKSFRQFLPWMTDQGRLSIVLFGSSGQVSSLSVPTETLPPLINTTEENKKKILSAIGENILKGEMTMERALEAAMKIIDQREETDQITGIFILKPPHGEMGYEIAQNFRNAMQQIDFAKEKLALKNKGFIIQPFLHGFKALGEVFTEGFKLLRAGVAETEFFVKPEESDLLKGIELKFPYSSVMYEGWRQGDGSFIAKRPSFPTGLQQELAFDLKIPRITQALPESPMEVKVASCQFIVTLADGSRIVKSADLVIIGEGEESILEEENKEEAREFYLRWGENWLFPVIRNEVDDIFLPIELLIRYKVSLDSSIAKDDEMLRNKLKEIEEEIDEKGRNTWTIHD